MTKALGFFLENINDGRVGQIYLQRNNTELDRPKLVRTKVDSAIVKCSIIKIDVIESFARQSMAKKLTYKKFTRLFFCFFTQRRTYGLKRRFSTRTFDEKTPQSTVSRLNKINHGATAPDCACIPLFLTCALESKLELGTS